MGTLTEVKIKTAKAKERAYKLQDGDGLFLYVTPAGGKVWRFRWRTDGMDTTISLGKYPLMSLKQAREKAFELQQRLQAGEDPRQKPEPVDVPTFGEVAAEWFAGMKTKWKPSYIDTVECRLRFNILPVLGKRKISDITGPEIMRMLKKIEARGAVETARRCLAMLGQIFKYAKPHGYIRSLPTEGLADGLQPRQEVKHFAAATTRKDAAFIVKAVRNYQGAPVVRLALEFLMLTFVRPGNVRRARWDHMDLEAKVWRIPGEDMKMGLPHDVPLSRQAMMVLESAKHLATGDGLVFPPVRKRQHATLSEAVFITALRTAGVPADKMTGHGFRAMASSLLNEAGEFPDVIEKQLAHSGIDPIREAYNRTRYWEARVALMQKWADMLDELEKL